jgi:DNA-binding response OmpR family regulator
VKGGSPVILAVSDHVESLAMYAIGLLASGLQVTTAARGEQAITRAQACSPDVIVVDEPLPDVSFEDFIHRLREDSRTMNARIIALTNKPSGSGREWSGADGCDLYLRLPCAPDALGVAIHRLLTHYVPVHRVSRARNAG